MGENSIKDDYKQCGCRYKENSRERSLEVLFDNQIWRVEEVARYLGCSVGHIYNLVSDEKIPKIKKGKFLYFIPEVIRDWILEGELQ